MNESESNYTQYSLLNQNGVYKRSCDMFRNYFFEAYLAYDEFDREFGIGRVTDTLKGSRTHINTNEKYPVDLYPNETFVFEELKKEGKRGIKRFSPGELVFAYIPTWVQYGATKDSYGIPVTDNYLLKKDIINIVEEHGVKSIDLDSEFIRKNDAPHTMYNDNKYGHFHPTAYREIGEYLAERFEKLTR